MSFGVPAQSHAGAMPVARHTHNSVRRAAATRQPPLIAAMAARTARPRAAQATVRRCHRRRRRVDASVAPSAKTRCRHRRAHDEQVHAAFGVQDAEAWSNADDLRTPSEVKAELARLRQPARRRRRAPRWTTKK